MVGKIPERPPVEPNCQPEEIGERRNQEPWQLQRETSSEASYWQRRASVSDQAFLQPKLTYRITVAERTMWVTVRELES